MFNKLNTERRLPMDEAAMFLAELRKEAEIHPMDVALGALVGGSMAAYRAHQRHKELPSGETPYSNEMRHMMESHLETRENPDPSWRDRIEEKMIAGRLRYARLAQENKNPAIALEALGGAIAGAVGGHQIGKAIRDSKAFGLLGKMGAAQIADVVGLRRDLLIKKAEIQNISVEDAANQELFALRLSKQASLTPEEQQFMNHMKSVQQAAIGEPPEPIKRASMNKAVHRGLKKRASMGELLMQKQLMKNQVKDVPESLTETTEDEPQDYRTPAREERRSELLGIFGGPSNKVAHRKTADPATLVGSIAGGEEARKVDPNAWGRGALHGGLGTLGGQVVGGVAGIPLGPGGMIGLGLTGAIIGQRLAMGSLMEQLRKEKDEKKRKVLIDTIKDVAKQGERK